MVDYVGVHQILYLCQSEDNLRELILSFNYVGSRNQTWDFGLGSKNLYPQSHLTDPRKYFLKVAVKCLLTPRDMFSQGLRWCESRTSDESRPSHRCCSFTMIPIGNLRWTGANDKVALRKLDMCFRKDIFYYFQLILNKALRATESQNYGRK